MTTQTLKTIPAASPERITSDVPKTKPAQNPDRVAFGKRLAERNRLARERKQENKLKIVGI